MPKIQKYGIFTQDTTLPVALEMAMIVKGGRFLNKSTGKMAGNGMEFHWKEAAKLLWPHLQWHEWNDLMVREWLKHRFVGIMGPTSSGKTNTAAWCHLLYYYCFPSNTTIIVCSTTRDRLEDRIWGEMKKLHRQATTLYRWLPGHLIEGKQRIVTDDRMEAEEGRDFRNGICGVPCKKGNQYVGLGDFVGLKNTHLMLCGDELQLLPPAFIDSLSNLMKSGAGMSRKVTGMGNPAETIDSLGRLCEPAMSLGGWDGGIDQTPKTKTWETRWPDGICIQLCGSDSPNTKALPSDPPPYPFLITRQNMEDDAKVWGVDDWHYTMFNEGRMPRGQGSRRVITRQMCQKFHALDDPLWLNINRTKIAFLDAAYRGVGGDRCVFGELDFGEEASPLDPGAPLNASAIISQQPNAPPRSQIVHLVDTMVIPITTGPGELPEDQIVSFVMKQCQQRGIPPENFYYDSGMRSSLVQAFGRLWSTKVNAIDCGGKPTERKVSAQIDVSCRDYYSKFITELWYSVRLVIEAGQFRGMTEDVMLEGCAREFKRVGANKIEVESKEDMKKKTGRSPDLFDALAIGVEGARQKGLVIKSNTAPRRTRFDDAWKRELREKAGQLRGGWELNYSA